MNDWLHGPSGRYVLCVHQHKKVGAYLVGLFIHCITWMVAQRTIIEFALWMENVFVTRYTSMQAKTFSAAREQEPFVSLGQAFNGTWLHRIKNFQHCRCAALCYALNSP